MANIDEIKQYNEWTLIPDSFEDTYIATRHVQEPKLIIPENVLSVLKQKLEKEQIFLGNDEVLKEIISGLVKGNIILQGPPGTGKTSIARIICDVFNVKANECTAVSEWTTYDTIGGLQPSVNDEDKEIVIGKNGRIVESVLDCCNAVLEREEHTGEKQASWLIIDELNRCEIDKVFGDLFTIFGSDKLGEEKSLSLWFEKDTNKKQIYIPNRYRIIGAMNNIDKNFVFDISQGLSRRFTFITILPPNESDFLKEIENAKRKAVQRVCDKLSDMKDINEEKILELLNDSDFRNADGVMCNLLKHIRYENDEKYLGLQIGTAQIIDTYENILLNMALFGYDDAVDKKKEIQEVMDSTVCNRITPQMEGFDDERLRNFLNYIVSDGQYEWFVQTKRSVEMKL